MVKKRILIVFGTRPEAIKMALLVQNLLIRPEFSIQVCVTAQHREMLDSVLQLFNITPDYDLNVMCHHQDLFDVTTKILLGIRKILQRQKYDIVLVHGDTTTSMATALAAFYEKVSIGHIEAGLRTYNRYSPWPEEINRQITARLATIHFAPTILSRENLLNENISNSKIIITGNTVIDSLYWVLEEIEKNTVLSIDIKKTLEDFGISKKLLTSWIERNRKMVLITGHRRENFGQGFQNICTSILELSQEFPDTDFVYPVHLNPNVRDSVKSVFGEDFLIADNTNIYFIEPLNYLAFVYLLKLSYIVLTDSGGIQEEAPSLGKPVLVMRNTTERPEALKAGTVQLVGTNIKKIKTSVRELITDEKKYKKMSTAINPYGDGTAVLKIINALL